MSLWITQFNFIRLKFHFYSTANTENNFIIKCKKNIEANDNSPFWILSNAFLANVGLGFAFLAYVILRSEKTSKNLRAKCLRTFPLFISNNNYFLRSYLLQKTLLLSSFPTDVQLFLNNTIQIDINFWYKTQLKN